MIVLDIETTGTDPQWHHLLSLGAVDYETGEEFYGECSCPYPTIRFDPIALEINGFKLEDIQTGKKQEPWVLVESFVKWAEKFPDKTLAGHNVGHLDLPFLEFVSDMVGGCRGWAFGYRTVDLHSVAFAHFGKSMSHSEICRELGIEEEPKPHNALAGAKSERAAFAKLFSDWDRTFMHYPVKS